MENGQILAELSIKGKQAFTEDLVLYIQKIVAKSKAKLTGISVAYGPGAYSGLRGGLAVAKSLAQALRLPLAAVSTLEALAYNLIDQTCTLATITDARRDEFNFALFTVKDRKLNRLTGDLVIKLDRLVELLSEIRGTFYVVGAVEDLPAGRHGLKTMLPEGSKITFVENGFVKGSSVALLGENLIKEGKTVDPLKLVPKYSHKPTFKEYK